MYFFIKMLAPYLPHTTEHIWEQRYGKKEKDNVKGLATSQEILSSVHLSPWKESEPWFAFFKKQWENNINQQQTSTEKQPNWSLSSSPSQLLDLVFHLLEKTRSQKASLKKSLSAPVQEIKIRMNKEDQALFVLCREDLARATHVSLENIHISIKDLRLPEILVTMEESLSPP